MNTEQRKHLITTVLAREELRPLSRGSRLLRAPLRTIPYYLLATLGHLRPFPISFGTLWNTNMTCYLPEGNTFYYYGYCEANLTNFFIRFVREGMTVIDVGAHVGIYSMLGSELVGPSGSVHSFEPTPRTFALLKKNTADLRNVTINNAAIAATPGTLTFADYGPGYGAYNSASSAGAQDTTRTPVTLSVPSLSLDTYGTERGLIPNLIKIDAEGFEYEVLEGASHLIGPEGHRPVVTIEVAGAGGWAENRTRSFAFLTERDYRPFSINPDGTITPHTLQVSYTYDNLVFIPAERVVETTQSLL